MTVSLVNEEAPLRPALKILVDKGGNKFAGEEGPLVDLLKEKNIFIARAIDPKAIGAKKRI